MYLYKFSVQIQESLLPVIIVAKQDDEAFEQVEIELEKHFAKLPSYEEITLYDCRRANSLT